MLFIQKSALKYVKNSTLFNVKFIILILSVATITLIGLPSWLFFVSNGCRHHVHYYLDDHLQDHLDDQIIAHSMNLY